MFARPMHRLSPGVLAGMLILAACGDDTAGPDGDFTREDAQAIAEFAGTFDVDLAFMDGMSSSDLIERHGEFSFTRDCPDGGTVGTSGQRSATLDTETDVVSTTWESVHTHDACAFTRTRGDREVTVVLDGSVTTTGEASFQLPETRGEGRTLLSFSATRVGQTVTTVGDRTRTCEIDVTQTYDPSSETFTITGTVCGRDVSVTGAPRDGRWGR